MSAIMNGIALHGGFINYGATFLIFMEYARNAVRMAALMKQQSTIRLHPRFRSASARTAPRTSRWSSWPTCASTPNMHTWRPCDTVESAVAWKAAIERRDGPTALVFSRQGLPHQARSDRGPGGSHSRAAAMSCTIPDGEPDGIVIATGSEVQLALDAAALQLAESAASRYASCPCPAPKSSWPRTPDYREAGACPRMYWPGWRSRRHTRTYWYKFVGLDGRVVGMTSFGESAPAGDLMAHLGSP